MNLLWNFGWWDPKPGPASPVCTLLVCCQLLPAACEGLVNLSLEGQWPHDWVTPLWPILIDGEFCETEALNLLFLYLETHLSWAAALTLEEQGPVSHRPLWKVTRICQKSCRAEGKSPAACLPPPPGQQGPAQLFFLTRRMSVSCGRDQPRTDEAAGQTPATAIEQRDCRHQRRIQLPPTPMNNPACPWPALALSPPILHLVFLVMSVAEGKPEQTHKSSPQDAGSQEIRFMREEVMFSWNCRREQLITQLHSLGTTASLGTKPLLFPISGKERGATGAERGGTRG